MREKIIMIILLISIILVAVLAIFGLKIGNLQILSISQLIDKNKEVINSFVGFRQKEEIQKFIDMV